MIGFEGGLRCLFVGSGLLSSACYQNLSVVCRYFNKLLSDELLLLLVKRWGGGIEHMEGRHHLFQEIQKLQERPLYGYVPRWQCLDPSFEWDSSIIFTRFRPEHKQLFPVRKDRPQNLVGSSKFCFIGQEDIERWEDCNELKEGENPLDFEPVCWTSCMRPVRCLDNSGKAVDVYAIHRYPSMPSSPLWHRVGGPLTTVFPGERPPRDPWESP